MARCHEAGYARQLNHLPSLTAAHEEQAACGDFNVSVSMETFQGSQRSWAQSRRTHGRSYTPVVCSTWLWQHGFWRAAEASDKNPGKTEPSVLQDGSLQPTCSDWCKFAAHLCNGEALECLTAASLQAWRRVNDRSATRSGTVRLLQRS